MQVIQVQGLDLNKISGGQGLAQLIGQGGAFGGQNNFNRP